MMRMACVFFCVFMAAPLQASISIGSLSAVYAAEGICGVAHSADQPQDPKEVSAQGQQEVPAPPAVPQANQRYRPHLIELSAQNWSPLSRREKFSLFWTDITAWEVHLSLATDAAISLATGDRQYLGDGARGFARRYGFNAADEANFVFFQAFLLPSLFHEDPRYIPMERGTPGRRAAYALSRVFVTRKDNGGSTLNRSLLLGTAISTAASNIYYPRGKNTELGASFARGAISLSSDAAFNIFKEFWPDFARKIRLNVWMRNLIRHAVRDSIRVD